MKLSEFPTIFEQREADTNAAKEFWVGKDARPGGRKRAADMLDKLQRELAGFAADFDRTCTLIGE